MSALQNEDKSLAAIVDGVQKIANYTIQTGERMDELERKLTGKSSSAMRHMMATYAPSFRDAIPDHRLKSARIEQVERWALGAGYKQEDVNRLAACDAWWRNKLLASSRHTSHPKYHEAADKLAEVLTTKANPLQEDTTTEGGHMVPTLVQGEMLRAIADSSVVYGRARKIPMRSKVTTIPSEATGPTTYWAAEEATLTGGEPVLGQVTLTANKLVGRATMSIELVEDSALPVLPYLQATFGEKMGGDLDLEAMEGTGSPFTGIVGASGVNALATTTGTVGDPITYDLIVDTFLEAGKASSRRNAAWVTVPAIFGKILKLTDSNGQPIVQTIGAVSGEEIQTIFGRPILVSDRLSSYTVGSDATSNLYFGPLDQLIFGERSMRVDVTDAVNWGTYQMDLRLVHRVAFSVGVGSQWTKLTKIDND